MLPLIPRYEFQVNFCFKVRYHKRGGDKGTTNCDKL